jgi:hypothetical protein
VAEPHTTARLLQAKEHYPGETIHLMRNFAGYAPIFRNTVDEILKEGQKE